MLDLPAPQARLLVAEEWAIPERRASERPRERTFKTSRACRRVEASVAPCRPGVLPDSGRDCSEHPLLRLPERVARRGARRLKLA